MLFRQIPGTTAPKHVWLSLLAMAAVSELAMGGEARNVQPPLLFGSSFETGSIDTSDWLISGNTPVVSTEVARAGKYSMKSVLDRQNSRISFRTEVHALTPKPLLQQEYWYGFSIYLPDGYASDPVWEVVAQWHDTPDEGENWRNPILAVWTDNGSWSVSNLWDDKAITPIDENGNFVYGGKSNYKLGAYDTGKWTDWVFRVKWSYKSDGILQVWKNGQLVIDQQSKPNCFNDVTMPYFKMGIYKGWKDSSSVGVVSKRVLFHDEFRMAGPGGSYEAVAPGGAKGELKPNPPGPLDVD